MGRKTKCGGCVHYNGRTGFCHAYKSYAGNNPKIEKQCLRFQDIEKFHPRDLEQEEITHRAVYKVVVSILLFVPIAYALSGVWMSKSIVETIIWIICACIGIWLLIREHFRR